MARPTPPTAPAPPTSRASPSRGCRAPSSPVAATSRGRSGAELLRIDQDARIERPGRVELRLHGPQPGGERLRALAVVPGSVIAADRVVVGDRAASVDHSVGDGGLDLVPLADLV